MLDTYTSIKAVYAHINDIHDVIITVLSRKRMLYHWLCTELDTQEERTLPVVQSTQVLNHTKPCMISSG